MASQANSTKHTKKLYWSFLNFSKKIEEEETLPKKSHLVMSNSLEPHGL